MRSVDEHSRQPRRGTDRLSVTTLGPAEAEALSLIEQHPGITVNELGEALGVGRARIWQIVSRLERGRVHRERG
jgi:uncharacterized membrane protein